MSATEDDISFRDIGVYVTGDVKCYLDILGGCGERTDCTSPPDARIWYSVHVTYFSLISNPLLHVMKITCIFEQCLQNAGKADF